MVPIDVRNELVADRQQSLIAHAAALRLAREARSAQRAAATAADAPPRWLALAWAVRIRPIRPSDAALLTDGFARLSPESRRMRFLGTRGGLSPAELRYFTDVDHHDHEALVAVTRFRGRGVGVARYVRSTVDPMSAEIAVTVVDAWQGIGVGTLLLSRLTERARCEGVRRLTALTHVDNRPVRRLLEKYDGPVRILERDGATVTFELTLVPAAVARRPVRAPLLRSSPAPCGGS